MGKMSMATNRKLVSSMPRRVCELFAKRGQVTSYSICAYDSTTSFYFKFLNFGVLQKCF